MKMITDLGILPENRPIKIVQFGEGNFLRAFVDNMIDIANEKGFFDGSIAIIKPISFGSLENFKKQNNLYTTVLRGKENGKTVYTSRVIRCISRVLDAAEDYDEYMSLAELDSLEFIVSNTTEAGIVLKKDDSIDALPDSYPGKLTKFLFKRYEHFNGDPSKGLIVLPVELIEDNGEKLLECVLALSDIWQLPDGFKKWIVKNNTFCSTLVDRIVTGYPGKEAAELIYNDIGYEDTLHDVGEPFALWVIESKTDISERLPLDKAGLPVIFTDNQRPYRERKVRVLNGAHTSSVLAAYLCGFDIVRDCMSDRLVGSFIRRAVTEEIAPHVPLPYGEVLDFASSVFERFENPFIDHSLLAISLNSVSKWRSRVLPSFKDHVNNIGSLPKLLTFSFAALLAFYTSDEYVDGTLKATRSNGDVYSVRDDRSVLEFFAENSKKPAEEFVRLACMRIDFWGEDLTKYDTFESEVTRYLDLIRKDPIGAMKLVMEN